MKTRHKRLAWIVVGLAVLAAGAAFILSAFNSNLVFFFTPTQVAAKEAPKGRTFRIGGLVEAGSLQRQSDGVSVRFLVTDTVNRVPVVYKGILPDLFKEGKGVVAQGQLNAEGMFTASEVLAKHDENYMPPEAADALARAKKAQSVSEKSLVQPATTGGPAHK